MNKPVAWMDYLEHSDVYDLNVSGRGIPLYTHPVKELTDEEIMDVCITGGIYDCINDPYMQKDGKYSLDIDLIRFAKAILRKAQEK